MYSVICHCGFTSVMCQVFISVMFLCGLDNPMFPSVNCCTVSMIISKG